MNFLQNDLHMYVWAFFPPSQSVWAVLLIYEALLYSSGRVRGVEEGGGGEGEGIC